MTQRVDLATVMDRLTIDELITSYAVAVDDGDWDAYRALFTPEGRADYRSSGGIEGPAAEVADWLAETMRLFPVRQHLIVNRRLHIQDLGGYPGDRAELQADYVNPMRLESGDDFVSGGRYTFGLLRTDAGWRLRTVVIHEKWRRAPDAPGGA
ncbi:nuclear transport factor 2 family protein [Streptomyces sp. NBC_01481]|uniref:nuclear transport factor 2 family protein n=1 Tax=Streptomyces sp. NBC_01481 TaxID=2975869 RepID=UPI002258EFC1|nr:nuclear transport factor 2 family protein [Streptomyces sp. NBC_01481]MCX4587492.1 nuclear transport factor 2 family protein [Streptomyces sp. NBC_01481]